MEGIGGSILVGFDGSESARNALRQALALRAMFKGEMHVVCSYVPYVYEKEFVNDEIDMALKESTEGWAREAVEIAGTTPVKTHVVRAEPYMAITETAADVGAALIVLGRRGASRLERMLMGSVTNRVIGHTACDVLIFPAGMSARFDKVMVGLDNSSFGLAALERAIMFASLARGEVTAISVVEYNDEFISLSPQTIEVMEKVALAAHETAATRAAAAGVKFTGIIKHGSPHKVIAKAATETGAGVLFMGSHGRKGLTKLIMGSVTEKVIGHAPCPVFVTKSN